MTKTAEEILCDRIEIRTPGDLIGITKDLRSLISDGKLRQVSGNVLVGQIGDRPPFPADLIEMEFETLPGLTRYRLGCETFRGYGGVFAKISGKD